MATTIDLSLKCPECDWEWSEILDAEAIYLKPVCPHCTHQPVLIVNITI